MELLAARILQTLLHVTQAAEAQRRVLVACWKTILTEEVSLAVSSSTWRAWRCRADRPTAALLEPQYPELRCAMRPCSRPAARC